MRTSHLGLLMGAFVAATVPSVAQQSSAPASQTTRPAPPRTTLAPGLRDVPDYTQLVAEPLAPNVPDGFTPIFNGRDMSGWHISQTARHGRTPEFRVWQGMILGTQQPLGRGGLLLTDRTYRDFELYMEVRPDWGNDSGVFFRTTENGAAYQVTMDYLPGGSMGRFIAEGGIQFGPNQVAPAVPQASSNPQDPGMAVWRRDDWNTVRIRVVGDIPRVMVWINERPVSDATDTENHAVGGMVEGPIAIQVHGGTDRWQPGGLWRWRTIAIKQLPRT